MEKPRSSASAVRTRSKYSDEICAHGATAPSRRDFSSSGTTRSGSTSRRNPMPVHSGHAPYGALKENVRGSISSSASSWSFGHARFSEKRRSRAGSSASASTSSTTTSPPASPRAVSTESVSRRWTPSRATRRSTTTSMSCLSFFSSAGTSVRVRTSPSTRARAKPLVWSSLKSSEYSPLRPRTTGARTW
ncbi:Uncharacterised protein [Mycobacteroides abscessus]|nr:Uncharacterised protein [Mycobacteroides abscessus]